ncbi:MAG: ABC transporter ATP-binding protein [Flavobacteriales bacterium]|nr:ABC transporter ATP-binding protein [Flavobacteriales bacterium]
MSMGIHTRALAVGHHGKPLLSGLDLEVPAGSLTALLGVNGIGKSTLLRCLAGLERPLAGEVTVDGDALFDLSGAERARRVAVVLSGRPAAGLVDVRTVVALGRQPWTGVMGRLTEADARAVEEAMERTGVQGLAHRYVQELSDGEAQRVMLARALAQATPVLLLDEPTAFLDVVNRELMHGMLRALATAGRTVLYTTHDVSAALEHADRLLVLTREGHWQGTPTEAVASGALERAFAHAGLVFDPVTRSFRSRS